LILGYENGIPITYSMTSRKRAGFKSWSVKTYFGFYMIRMVILCFTSLAQIVIFTHQTLVPYAFDRTFIADITSNANVYC